MKTAPRSDQGVKQGVSKSWGCNLEKKRKRNRDIEGRRKQKSRRKEGFGSKKARGKGVATTKQGHILETEGDPQSN